VHLDTVGVEAMQGDPFSGEISDGRVYGRGAVDTKASLAVALGLLRHARRTGQALPHSLLVAATVDEESGARGAPAFAGWLAARHLAIDELMVAEPTGCQPVFSQKGVARMEFEIHGVAAHSSQPHTGRNAVVEAARLILAFEDEARRVQAGDWPAQSGAPTLTVTLVRGGAGINIVPDRCLVSLDYRVVPGQQARRICEHLEALAVRTCTLPVISRVLLALDAFYQSPDSPFVLKLAEWSEASPTTVHFGTNAWAYGGHPNIRECVILGPGSIEQAHTRLEWVSLEELGRHAELVARWWGIAL
jgi:acetylornithine deacetylase/succinyl-diaminopimelate desuccinylase-like protein